MEKMKTMVILAIMLIGSGCHALAQKLFTEAANLKGVTSVYVGKPMLTLVGSQMLNQGSGKFDISKIINDINSVEIIESSKDDAGKNFKKAKDECDKVIGAMDFQPLVDLNDEDGDNVQIIGTLNDDGSCYTNILIRIVDDEDMVYIMLTGNISMEDMAAAFRNSRMLGNRKTPEQ